jgi:putative endopeptidase
LGQISVVEKEFTVSKLRMNPYLLACSSLLITLGGSLVLADSTSESEPRIPRFSVSYLDRSVDPRKDFYHYAAGSWVKDNPVPPDKSRWASFTELAERNWFLIHQILDQAKEAAVGASASPRKQVGDFFASAIDTNHMEQLGLQPIQDDLRRVDAVASSADLLTLLADFHERGIAGFFDASVSPDAKNSAIYAFELTQGGLSLPDRDYYLKDSFAAQRKAYRAHLQKMFQLLGESEGDATNHASDVLDIETALAKASRTRVELRDPDKNYNKFTTPDLLQKYSGLPWKPYLAHCGLNWDDSAGNPESKSGHVPLPYEIVGQPEFFEALNGLLQERPLSDLKVYLRWHVLHGSAPYLSRAVEDENFAFFGKVLSGQEEQEPRWKRAAQTIDRSIGEALGQLYVEKYFPPAAKAKVNQLVDDLRAVFREHLEKVEWMTDATRAQALAKFTRFTQKIGYPDKFRDYSSVEIRPDDYLGNVRRAAAFESHRELVRIGKPVDKTEWHMTPETVNAYFNPLQNEIVFPAGILQPPFFDPNADDAVNYGGIGVVIGHEITHGYDDEGRKFDADGNLHGWWTDDDAKAFEERAQKVVDEYNAFQPLPGLHVNGKLTLGENIADLGGVVIAYDALQLALQKDPAKRVKIDGLTPEQRFFISFAQIWRTNIREPEQRRRITIDPHSPGQFRAIGPLVNLPVFYQAFGVESGDLMWRSPEQRAKIW